MGIRIALAGNPNSGKALPGLMGQGPGQMGTLPPAF